MRMLPGESFVLAPSMALEDKETTVESAARRPWGKPSSKRLDGRARCPSSLGNTLTQTDPSNVDRIRYHHPARTSRPRRANRR